MAALNLLAVAHLTDPARLESIFGPIASIERAPLPTAGRSGARHERVTIIHPDGRRRNLVLKTVVPAESWTAYRSGDRTGREGLILGEPALYDVWDCIASPYIAFALEREKIGLLMDDLAPWLHPPNRRLSIAQEDTFLRALAGLHARFWRAEALALPWLAPLSVRFSILAPGAVEQELQRHPGHPLFRAVARGWELALGRVAPPIRDLLLAPAEELAARFVELPATLLHGDAKSGNCAFLPEDRIALFDWATPGSGPATIDLYYFLAVDAARHARSRDAIVASYRRHLQSALGHTIPDGDWKRFQQAGIAAAARMLLWSMALALERGEPGAESDWSWWMRRLATAAR